MNKIFISTKTNPRVVGILEDWIEAECQLRWRPVGDWQVVRPSALDAAGGSPCAQQDAHTWRAPARELRPQLVSSPWTV